LTSNFTTAASSEHQNQRLPQCTMLERTAEANCRQLQLRPHLQQLQQATTFKHLSPACARLPTRPQLPLLLQLACRLQEASAASAAANPLLALLLLLLLLACQL
jgi:hypothetical protein